MFASVSGTAAAGAARLQSLFTGTFYVYSLNLSKWKPGVHAAMITQASVVLLLSSTYGSGAPPVDAEAFLSWLRVDSTAWQSVPFAVLGYGSSSYPRFCAAADVIFAAVVAAGGSPLIQQPGKIDALGDGEMKFAGWLRDIAAAFKDRARNGDPPVGSVLLALEAAFAGSVNASYDMSSTKSIELLYNFVQMPGAFNRKNPRWPGTSLGSVISSTQLLSSARTEDRSTLNVMIDASAVIGGVQYLPGDNIAIYARSSPARVRMAITCFVQ